MNEVFISGKIISDIDFSFIYNRNKKEKYTSIASCKLELENNSVVNVYGYDDIADYLYRENMKEIYIEGRIDSNMMIEIKDISSAL